MTTFAFPSALTPNRSTFGLVGNSAVFGDPLKGTVQTLNRPGAKWRVTMQFTGLTNDDAGELNGLLARLEGQTHRVTIHDHGYVQRGDGSGTITVNGGGQTGSTLVTAGWSGTNPIMRAGDMFSVNGELKMVTQDVNRSGGAATLSFAPSLRASPSNGASVDITNPTATFMLAGPSFGRDRSPAQMNGFAIEFIEVFT